MKKLFIAAFLGIGVIAALVGFKLTTMHQTPAAVFAQSATDWPQLQHDARRTGFTTASVDPSRMRARWIWFGSNWILRNKNSETLATWDDDLTSAEGKVLSMPTSVPYSFAESMQPIIVNNKLFVGDVKQQKVWALNFFDGSTLWEQSNPGGTAWSGVATSTTVIFPSLYGYLTAWNANTGQQLWQIDTGKSISHAPVLVGDIVYTASQNGKVYAVNINTGNILWQTDTGAPIQGGLAVDGGKVFVGNEAMYAISLNASTGTELNRTKLMGQSFRRIWPVVTGGRVIFQTVQLPWVGSEYVMNNVINGTEGSFSNELAKIRSWLTGSGSHFEHLFALDTADMSKDYVVANGAVGGVGHHADPPVVNKNGLPLVWWPTYFAKISSCSFGCPTNYNVDIMGIDLTNGNGVQLPNSGARFTSTETDNTFAMTMANDVLFLRQEFRGTKAVDFTKMTDYRLSAIYRYQDCGGWHAALNYAQGTPGCPPASWNGVVKVPDESESFSGHVGPAITSGIICFTEKFAVTCMEDY